MHTSPPRKFSECAAMVRAKVVLLRNWHTTNVQPANQVKNGALALTFKCWKQLKISHFCFFRLLYKS